LFVKIIHATMKPCDEKAELYSTAGATVSGSQHDSNLANH
jgi:hypothetical protein